MKQVDELISLGGRKPFYLNVSAAISLSCNVRNTAVVPPEIAETPPEAFAL